MTDSSLSSPQQAAPQLQQLGEAINARLIGQQTVVAQVLMALLASGHVLLEGVPGLGKTLLVRILAHCFGGHFRRIQFTPDLMPADITGHAIYDMNAKTFNMHRGPIFTNLLLADEINRAPAKSQAALLEVMQERQVTIEGKSIPVPAPYMVLATQNPLEQEGTYPLPEAELDRFFMKIVMDYPKPDDEVRLTQLVTGPGNPDDALSHPDRALISAEALIGFQNSVAAIIVDPQVVDYAVRIVRCTREHPSIYRGAGSRSCIDLVKCAKAHAFMAGRDYVIPDDVKTVALPIVRHRIALTPDAGIEGLATDTILQQLLKTIDAPRM